MIAEHVWALYYSHVILLQKYDKWAIQSCNILSAREK